VLPAEAGRGIPPVPQRDRQTSSAGAGVHVVVDNSSIHASPPIRRWLRRHPRFHLHFTPTYSSWLNLVERWFAKLTEEALRRGSHVSTASCERHRGLHRRDQRRTKAVRLDQERRPDPGSVARFCAHTLADADLDGFADSGH